jgi:hypothetical protein
MALDLTDKTANANNLTNVGADEVTNDQPFVASTKAADFERGDSDYMTAAESASLSITGTISIEAWLKLESLPSAAGANMCIMSKDDTGGTRGWNFFVNSANDKLYFFASSDGTTSNFIQKNTDATLAANEWHHWAVTYNPGTGAVVIYKDGSSVAITDGSAGSSSAITDTNTDTHVGASKNGGGRQWYMDGKLDELRIWNDIRSGAEISANYNVRLTGLESNLVAYWPYESLVAAGGGGGSPMFFGGGLTIG